MQEDPGLDVAPVLEENKQRYVFQRFWETLLGGIVIYKGQFLPWYTYVAQGILFIIPLVVGFTLNILIENLNYRQLFNPIVAGGFGFFWILIFHGISFVVHKYKHDDTIGGIFEDEEIVEIEGICSKSHYTFLFPQKNSFIIYFLDAFIFGGSLSWAVYLFQIDHLKKMNIDSISAYIISGLLWVIYCLASFSLTCRKPPEPNQSRTYETLSISRIFHMLILLILFHISVSENIQQLMIASVCGIISLPFFWIVGFLPQADVFISWATEQITVIFYGGSEFSDWRKGSSNLTLSLIFHGMLFGISFLSVGFAQSIAILFGFISSFDIIGWMEKILNYWEFGNKIRALLPGFAPHQLVSFPFSIVTPLIFIIYSIIIFLLSIPCLESLNQPFISKDISLTIMILLCGIILCGIFIVKSCNHFSSTFILRIVRNPLRKFKSFKLFSELLLWLEIACCLFGGIWSKENPKQSDYNIGQRLLYTGLAYGAFRRIWRMPEKSALRIAISAIIHYFENGEISFFLIELIVSFTFSRLSIALKQLHFIFVAHFSLYINKRLRFRHFIVSNIIWLCITPILIPFWFLGVLVDAPCIPIFGVPLFIPSFPRLKKTWNDLDETQNSSEAVYYRQMKNRAIEAFLNEIKDGVISEPEPGQVYVMRSDPYILWIEVLEFGRGFLTINFKGLELQTTSCHALEASYMDGVFEEKYYFNHHPFDTLQPLGKCSFQAFSENEISLVGLIDDTQNSKRFARLFGKTIVWLIIKYPKNCFFESRGYPILDRKEKLSRINTSDMKNLPWDWFQHVIASFKESFPENDPDLIRFLMAANASIIFLVQEQNFMLNNSVGFLLNEFFSGNIPETDQTEWIKQNAEIEETILKACRISCKLLLEETAYQEVLDNTELFERLEELEDEWYIGSDVEEWHKTVENETKQYLFTMQSHKSVHKAKTAFLEELDWNIAQLNEEAVRGFWAALNLEMLYFTNDDDERYSIQAHFWLMRNLSIQAAQPPLGYPAYSSGPQVVFHGMPFV